MINIPLSLYIHFPWCVKKCPYCDFNSHESSGSLPENEYVDRLIEDLTVQMKNEPRQQLCSIFMGGGTPSLFRPAAIRKLLAAIATQFEISQIEITMETNPGTFDQANFSGYRDAGVNRLSIGAQSFDSHSLQSLGRIHNPDDVTRAFLGARRAGFERINIDLMHGLPNQNCDAALKDLDCAIELNPEHISWYQLTIERNTVFNRYPPVLPDEETMDKISALGLQRLTSSLIRQYEISAYAKPGEQSRHNLNYWQFGDYMGIGAGAHGKLTRDSGIFRTTRSRVPKDYMVSTTGDKTVPVDANDLNSEFLMNALRLNRGFTKELFETRTLRPLSEINSFIEKATAARLLEVDAKDIRATTLGRQYLDDLLLLAIP